MRRTKRKNIIKETIVNFVDTNAKTYIVVAIMLLIGLILGIISINNINEEGKNQIISYISNFIENIKSGVEISSVDILKNDIKNNVFTTLILWFLGSTIIGMPLIFAVIIYKGYSIGYSMAAIIAALGTGKGIIFILSTMLLKYIIYVPCIISVAVSGIKLYKLIIEDRRKDNIKLEIIKHTIRSLIIFCILIGMSIIETTVAVNIIKMVAKYL